MKDKIIIYCSRKEVKMANKAKINLLERRLQILTARGKTNCKNTTVKAVNFINKI